METKLGVGTRDGNYMSRIESDREWCLQVYVLG
jgi:hypothetical protein